MRLYSTDVSNQCTVFYYILSPSWRDNPVQQSTDLWPWHFLYKQTATILKNTAMASQALLIYCHPLSPFPGGNARRNVTNSKAAHAHTPTTHIPERVSQHQLPPPLPILPADNQLMISWRMENPRILGLIPGGSDRFPDGLMLGSPCKAGQLSGSFQATHGPLPRVRLP
jgi:hypothetical protein